MSSVTKLALLVVTITAVMVGVSDSQEIGCGGDMPAVIMECARFVQRLGPVMDPSPRCCTVLKTLDVPCICGKIPNEVAAMVDMNKVVHVASFCGLALPRGLKCGSQYSSFFSFFFF
ncbi:hypothetical protein LINGRAHAP2_LOCUS8721 [Linum grandiflorum]